MISWKDFLNENIGTRVYLSQNGFDGFGYCMDIHLKQTVDSKLSYTPCYTQYGLLRYNVDTKNE